MGCEAARNVAEGEKHEQKLENNNRDSGNLYNADHMQLDSKMKYAQLVLAFVLTGCATQMNTPMFYEREAAIHAECSSEVKARGGNVWAVNPTTGRSSSTDGLICYQHKLTIAAYTESYPNASLVDIYGSFLVSLGNGLDKGLIDRATAIDQYKRARERLVAVITDADRTRQAQETAEFVSIMSGLSAALAVSVAAQNVGQSPRMITCHPLTQRGNGGVTCF